MKAKSLSLIALFAITTLFASAQDAKKFRFGLTGGLNVSSVAIPSQLTQKYSPDLGGYGGLLVDYHITEKVYASTSILYSLRRFRTTSNKGYEASFAEIPLHIGYRLPIKNKVSLFGEVGPYVAVGTHGIEDRNDQNYLFNEKDYKDVEIGLGLTAGVEFYHFQIRCGYNKAQTSMFKSTYNGKINNLQIGIAYMF